MTIKQKLVKIRVALPNHPVIRVETLWASRVEKHRYRLENVPFFAYDINHHDIVEAYPTARGLRPTILRVIERSGNQTLRVLFAEHVTSAEQKRYLEALTSVHVAAERFSAHFLALNVAPAAEMIAIHCRLDQLESEGVLSYETCEARCPGSFDELP